MTKTNDELWSCYQNDDFDDLNIEELEKLEKLVKIRGKKVTVEGKIVEPTDKIEINGDKKNAGNGNSENIIANNFDSWYENLEEKQDDEGKELLNFFKGYFINTDSDTGCEDIVSDWSPADTYAKKVWSTAICHSDLFRIAVKGLEIDRGDGLNVKIRVAGAFGDPVEKASCECGSCTSIPFTAKTLTLKQYNLEAIVCEKDSWDVGDALMESYIVSMSNSWKKFFDAQIYNEIYTATEGTTETLANALACDPSISGSCCSDSAMLDMWNAINAAIALMREGTGLTQPMNPDYIIISPSVAAIFKRMQTPETIFYKDVIFDSTGRLSHICGIKAIEYCGASACTNASGAVVAVIVDSSRAVGAAFGKRPQMYKFFQSNCNSYRIDWWSFFACSELDTEAIAHIKNP